MAHGFSAGTSKKELVCRGLCVIFLILPSPSIAADEWSKGQKIGEALYLGLHVIDWRQSRYSAKRPDEYYEKNFILGKHPSSGFVDGYFIVTGVGHVLITHFLPERWRPLWLTGTIIMEVVCIKNNFSLKIGWGF